MKKKLFKIAGVIAVVFTLVANLQYAMLDYGIGSITPGTQLIAQTSGSGGGTSGGGTSGGGTSGGGTSGGTSGDNNKVCGLDECTIIEHVGIPPYQVDTERKGHFMHCQLTMDNTKHCSSSSCDEPCDAAN